MICKRQKGSPFKARWYSGLGWAISGFVSTGNIVYIWLLNWLVSEQESPGRSLLLITPFFVVFWSETVAEIESPVDLQVPRQTEDTTSTRISNASRPATSWVRIGWRHIAPRWGRSIFLFGCGLLLFGQLLFMNSGLRSYWAYRPTAVVVWGGSDWVTMA